LEPADVTVDVVLAQRGDRAAFARLYERFHRVVHAVIMRLVPLPLDYERSDMMWQWQLEN
jgi:hypothetical protein